MVRHVLPQTEGTITIAGLQQPVTVKRDSFGVPHIKGATLHDVMFAQGYVTAQDRLFQMDLNRHIAQGRLAEIFGAGDHNALFQTDALLRALGIYRAAEQDLSYLDVRTLLQLQAYSDGVNAFLQTHQHNLPLEFSLLGINPLPWTMVDSLAYGRVVALSLDNTWYYKYVRALVQARVGARTTAMLFPAYPSSNPTLLSTNHTTVSQGPATSKTLSFGDQPSSMGPKQQAFASLSNDFLSSITTLRTFLGPISDALGSNNWVVDGTKTQSGKPLLANDPHLDISMPSIWYEVELQGGGLNVIGFSFPGVPGVIIGHNDHIAWGMTNVGVDNSDLYLETVDVKHHPGEYKYNNQWLPFQVRDEKIFIRGKQTPINLTVRSTLHGPLLNTVVNDLHPFSPISLKWTALQPGYSFTGFFQLDFAHNWQEFQLAVDNISISQNFIYADINGNIGYRMSGWFPIRDRANRELPVDGSVSTYEWKGYVPNSQLPTLFNPPNHMIVTANNRIVPDTYPVYLTEHWDRGYRAERITNLLQTAQPLTSLDYQHIQSDVYSVPASIIVPYLLEAGKSATGDAALAVQILRTWDDRMTSDSVAATVYEETVGTLLRQLIGSVLGKNLYQTYVSNYEITAYFQFITNILEHPTPPFMRGNNLQVTRDHLIVAAMSNVIQSLHASKGSDLAQWQWGKIHQVHFQHPLVSVQPLNLLFDIAPLPRPGDDTTINVGGDGAFVGNTPRYEQKTVSSMRMIVDLSNFDHSLWVITTGQSGQPGSVHYQDLVPLWNQNVYQPMDFSDLAVDKSTTQLLTLQT
jgi:penicillin amidase